MTETKSKLINIRVSPTELHQIRQVVKNENGKNISHYTRQLILSNTQKK
jgi:hypothetical protein